MTEPRTTKQIAGAQYLAEHPGKKAIERMQRISEARGIQTIWPLEATDMLDAFAAEKARADAAEAERDHFRDALTEIANAFTAHGYSVAMDAVQALKDTAKEAINAKR